MTNQNANQDEPDLWMPDSKSFGVGWKKLQTTARRVRCPKKSASGNHLGQNDPLPPAVDDEVVEQPQSTWVEGADIVMRSSGLPELYLSDGRVNQESGDLKQPTSGSGDHFHRFS